MIYKTIRLSRYLLLFVLSGSAFSETIFKATYELTWGIMTIGKVERTLSVDSGIYTFSSHAKPEGLAVFLTDGFYEKSVFKFIENKVQPISYLKEEEGDKVEYHYQNSTLTVTGKQTIVIKNIPDNSGDYLNIVYGVMRGLANQQTKFAATIHESPRSPELFEFVKKNQMKIETPAGKFNTVLVEKIKTDALEFQIWLSPEHGYMPVKVHNVSLQGHNFEMELIKFTQ